MSKGARSARAAGKVGAAVLVSRVLGLVREQIFAHFFGAGLFMDAWRVAFRLPNLLRDLFAEGALSTAFVPTFTQYLEKEGKAKAWQLANLVLSALLIVGGLITLLFIWLSDYLVYLLAAGFASNPSKAEVTSSLIQLLSPFLMLVALAAVVMGILNTLNHFFLPALAPAFFNLAVIAAGLFLVPRFEAGGTLSIYAMAAGAVAGGFLQLAVQLPILRQEGFRFRFRLNFRHPGILRMQKLIGPAILGVGAVQVNLFVNTQLASFLPDDGPLSWLGYAFRIIYLPIGLFGVAVATVNLKEVSVYAARSDWEALRETVANSLKMVAFLALPSMVGLIVLARPVVSVIYERGAFTTRDTLLTSYAVMAYSLGLLVYTSVRVYVPTFYALNDTRTPVRASLASVLANLTINVTLILSLPSGYKYLGLAFGTACSAAVNNALLMIGFRKRLGKLTEFGVGTTLFKISLAAVLMGAVLVVVDRGIRSNWVSLQLPGELLVLLVSIAAGASSYFLFCLLFRIEQVRFFR